MPVMPTYSSSACSSIYKKAASLYIISGYIEFLVFESMVVMCTYFQIFLADKPWRSVDY